MNRCPFCKKIPEDKINGGMIGCFEVTCPVGPLVKAGPEAVETWNAMLYEFRRVRT